jgi:hypothetical protein
VELRIVPENELQPAAKLAVKSLGHLGCNVQANITHGTEIGALENVSHSAHWRLFFIPSHLFFYH